MSVPGSSRLPWGSCAQPQKRKRLAADCAQSQGELGGFADRGTGAEHIEILPLYCIQNLKTAATEQIEIDCEIVPHHRDQRKAFFEHPAGEVNLVGKQIAKFLRRNSLPDRLVGHTEALHV